MKSYTRLHNVYAFCHTNIITGGILIHYVLSHNKQQKSGLFTPAFFYSYFLACFLMLFGATSKIFASSHFLRFFQFPLW
jgi:hypothetical protein